MAKIDVFLVIFGEISQKCAISQKSLLFLLDRSKIEDFVANFNDLRSFRAFFDGNLKRTVFSCATQWGQGKLCLVLAEQAIFQPKNAEQAGFHAQNAEQAGFHAQNAEQAGKW